MARMPKISIIIPVYNAEKYLVRCIKSVLTSLGDIPGEILLIDNNSTDKSLEIINQFAKQNKSKIGALQCNTPGASASRNLGARKARGEYLWFIDADDYIAKGAVKKLLATAKRKNADIVMMSVKRLYLDGKSSLLSAVDQNAANYKSRFVRYGMGPWQVILRRKWWQQNSFSFPEGIIHEDMALMSALILYTDRYASIDEALYYYCETPGSVLHKKDFSPHIFDIFPALEKLYQMFADKNAVHKYHAELEWFFIWNLLIDSAKDFGNFEEGRSGFRCSREMLKKYFPKWRRNQFLKQKPVKLRIRVILNYYK